MDAAYIVGGLLVLVAVLATVRLFWPRPVVVREYESGLRLRKGRMAGEVAPGRYWLRPRVDELQGSRCGIS